MRLIFVVFLLVLVPHSPAFPWLGRSPVPSRHYFPEELMDLEQQKLAAFRKDDGFFVDLGHIFYMTRGKDPQHVRGFSRTTSILLYKNKLIALNEKGHIALLIEEKQLGSGEWYELGHSAIKLLTDGIDLYALTERKTWMGLGSLEKGVSVYKGEPGDLNIVFVSRVRSVPSTNSVTTQVVLVPEVAGRDITFEDLKLSGVADLVLVDNKVMALIEYGQAVILSKNP
jgi:hypothetical protein